MVGGNQTGNSLWPLGGGWAGGGGLRGSMRHPFIALRMRCPALAHQTMPCPSVPGNKEVLRTADGFEITVGTNHLGHFLLANLLLPQVKAAGSSARVVVTASEVHDPASPGGSVGNGATLGDLSGLEQHPNGDFVMIDGGAYDADKVLCAVHLSESPHPPNQHAACALEVPGMRGNEQNGLESAVPFRPNSVCWVLLHEYPQNGLYMAFAAALDLTTLYQVI